MASGKSHYRSHIVGYDGTQNIASVNNVTALGTLAVPIVNTPIAKATSYIQVGSRYIVDTDMTSAASIIVETNALFGGLTAGSIVLGAAGIWVSYTASHCTAQATP